MRMIGEVRFSIVGTMEPMLSISTAEGGMFIELFGEEISQLRNWLNEQKEAFLPSDGKFRLPVFTPQEWDEIRKQGDPD
jgi:hypothetical protein